LTSLIDVYNLPVPFTTCIPACVVVAEGADDGDDGGLVVADGDSVGGEESIKLVSFDTRACARRGETPPKAPLLPERDEAAVGDPMGELCSVAPDPSALPA
jgi:hypothetical protein